MKENKQTYEALPIEVIESALSPAKMKVLNVLYRYNTLDTSIENGTFYISNEDLKTEAQIGDNKKTFYDVISFFNANNFITRQSGSRTKEEGAVASTYVLHTDVILDWAVAHPKKGKGTPKMGTPKKSKCTDEVVELRAEVKSLRAEVAELRALLMGLPMGLPMGTPNMGLPMEENCNRCTPDTDIEKETTYHSVPECNNYRVGSIYTRPDEAKNDEAVETVGSVCDFQKNRVEGVQSQAEETTPNATANEIETPKAKVTPEERVKELDNLQLWKMQTPNVDPIEIATELGEILTNEMYQSHTYTKAATVGVYLAKYANDIDTLNQIEKRLMSAHIEKYGHGHSTIDYVFNERRKELANQTANKADQSVADTKDKETIIQTAESDQNASQRANQGSGDIDSIPHDGETSQTSENKASGSVSAPQMGKLSIQTEKTRQKRPDEAREAMTEVKCISVELEKWQRSEYNYNENPELESVEADNAVNSIAHLIGEIKTVGELNWCDHYINKAFEVWGWVLGNRFDVYFNSISRQLQAKRIEFEAA